MLTVRKLKHVFFFLTLLFLLVYFGVFTHLLESDFDSKFRYPYEGDIEECVQQLQSNIKPKIPPINNYNFKFIKNCSHKCRDAEYLRLIFLVKSAPEHVERRKVIRSAWGREYLFADVEMRTVFLLGERNDSILNNLITAEALQFMDIVQGNFTDDYYNNTLKTMMGFTWAAKFCSRSQFYMFVDDDYFVSTKNVLHFIRNPANYPNYLKNLDGGPKFFRSLNQFDPDLDETVRLYAGYAFVSSPLRHFSSKWYVSLEEYPFDRWPPYVTAGAYVLSRQALLDMYYASFYTQHFRFDDIYAGLLALKSKIEPFHCDEFHFYKLDYSDLRNYRYAIASHGFSDPKELLALWTQLRSLKYA